MKTLKALSSWAAGSASSIADCAGQFCARWRAGRALCAALAALHRCRSKTGTLRKAPAKKQQHNSVQCQLCRCTYNKLNSSANRTTCSTVDGNRLLRRFPRFENENHFFMFDNPRAVEIERKMRPRAMSLFEQKISR